MGEDGESRRSFITRNAKDVRFLDVWVTQSFIVDDAVNWLRAAS